MIIERVWLGGAEVRSYGVTTEDYAHAVVTTADMGTPQHFWHGRDREGGPLLVTWHTGAAGGLVRLYEQSV